MFTESKCPCGREAFGCWGKCLNCIRKHSEKDYQRAAASLLGQEEARNAEAQG